MQARSTKALQLIVTVHGIRTHGFWQERLERLVSRHQKHFEIEFVNFKFGYFSAISFLLPFARNIVARRFRNEIIRLFAAKPYARIDLVGHSFGTFVIAKAITGLREEHPFKIDTVILSGSVLPSEFPWHKYLGVRVRRVVNDCGSKDAILLLSNYFVFATGMAGRTGFNGSTGATLRNRFSSFGHSGYFEDEKSSPSDEYMRRHWRPLLVTDEPARGFDFRKPPTTFDAFTEGLATHSGRIKFALYVTPFVVLSAIYYSLWINAETQRRIKERVAENAAFSASDFIYKIFGSSAGQIDLKPSFGQVILSEARSALNDLDGVAPVAEPLRKRGLAAVLIEQSALDTERGNVLDGMSNANRAIEMLKGLRSPSSSNADIQFDLATAFDRLGVAQARNEDIASSIEAFNESGALLQQLRSGGMVTEKLLKNFAANKEKLGSMQVSSNSLDQAEESFKESCKLRSELSQTSSSRADLELDLGRCRLEYGHVLLMAGKIEQAQTELSNAVAIGERLPVNPDTLLFMAKTSQRLGELDEKRGSNVEWEAHYRKALGIHKSIIGVEANRPEVSVSLAAAALNLGFLLKQTTRTDEALSLYRDCLQFINTRTVTSNNLTRMKARLGVAIADIERDTAHLESARSDYLSAIAVLEGSMAARLARSLWRTDLLDAYRRASDVSFNICGAQGTSQADCREDEAWQLANRRSNLALLVPADTEQAREEHADILSDEAWKALFANKYARSLEVSRLAVDLLSKPTPINLQWIEINRAHALMFNGHIDDARAIYQIGSANPSNRTIIENDFKLMLQRRKCHALMAEIVPEVPACDVVR